MKQGILSLFAFLAALTVTAQTNTFPASGSVGIGTTDPQGKLQVYENGRNYYVNRAIPGNTEDAQGWNYLLLHRIYTNVLLADHFVMGTISAIRGNAGAWNRKWTVEVNTASAYNTNRGSIISYNEPATLVTLTHNGERYLAVTISNSSILLGFSFTGYAQNETLSIAFDDQVSNVQPFVSLDPLMIQGRVGIGTTATGSNMLTVEGTIGARKVKITQGDWADFVFAPGYKLSSLQDLECYIKENKHLPDIPTEKEAKADGIDVGEMNKKLLQKVEELTLYLISLEKENHRINAQNNVINEQYHALLKRVENLENR